MDKKFTLEDVQRLEVNSVIVSGRIPRHYKNKIDKYKINVGKLIMKSIDSLELGLMYNPARLFNNPFINVGVIWVSERQKVTFADLSVPLKIIMVFAGTFLAIWVLMFITGFFIGVQY